MTLNLPNPGQDYSPAEHAQSRRIIAQAVNSITSAPGFPILAHAPRVIYAQDYGAKGDGITDDTAAIQAAISAGRSFDFLPGVYTVSATLLLNTLANEGQLIRGAGAPAFTGSGVGKTIIRPTSAVTTLFRTDGAPTTEVYIMGMAFEGIGIDMVNMTDVAASVAFEQHNAFDVSYSRCRAYNYGLNKVSWHFQDGAFTTQMSNCGGGIVSFQGLSIGNATTTITMTNCDILSVQHDSFQNITFVGGAIQKPYAAGMKILYLAPGKTPYAFIPNTGGLYVAVMSEINNSIGFSSIGTDWEQGGGYPATFNDGTHGTLQLIPVVMVDTNCINTTFINPTFAGCYFLDYGINTRLIGQGQSGVTGFDISTGVNYILNDFRVSGILSGPVGFTGAVGSETSSSYTLNGATGLSQFKGQTIRPTVDGAYSFQVNNAGNTSAQLNFTTGATTGVLGVVGTVQGYFVKAQPATDSSNVFVGANAANTQLVNFSTNVTPSVSQWNFANGIQVQGFSDSFSTLKWSLNCVTGAFNTASTLSVNNIQVVTARQTGWVAPTGTLSRATFDQSTVTLPELAKRLAALITDLTTHGLIGI